CPAPACAIRTSARTTTNVAATSTARSLTTSASSAPSDSKSPFAASPNPNLTPPEQATKQPDPHRPFHPAPLHCARCCRAPSRGSIFGSVTSTTTHHGRCWTTVDTTPEVRRAMALAAWACTWLRDEEAIGAAESARSCVKATALCAAAGAPLVARWAAPPAPLPITTAHPLSTSGHVGHCSASCDRGQRCACRMADRSASHGPLPRTLHRLVSYVLNRGSLDPQIISRRRKFPIGSVNDFTAHSGGQFCGKKSCLFLWPLQPALGHTRNALNTMVP